MTINSLHVDDKCATIYWMNTLKVKSVKCCYFMQLKAVINIYLIKNTQ